MLNANLIYDLARASQQDRLREAEQARLANQVTQQTKGYEFFFRSQPIFNPKQPGRLIYVVVEGEVAIFQNERLIETMGPGHYLAETTLPPAAGLIAIAHTDCRLVAINEVMLAVLAQCPPEIVAWIIPMMMGLPRLTPKIRWPASILASRAARQAKRPREQAELFPVVRNENRGNS
jgi:CRP-like cAMP-binding protein